MKMKKWKLILTLVLAAVLAAGAVSGYLVMAHQPDSQILDHTMNEPPATEGEDNSGDDSGDVPTQAVLSQNIVIFTQEEAKAVNAAILTISSLDSGVEMKIANGSALESMGVGDIFFLEGDKNTPFGMTYIGKIDSVIPGEDSSIYILQTPMMDEVFDVLSFSESGVLAPNNLVSVECIPGVSLVGEAEQQSLSAGYGGYVTNLSSSGGTVVPLVTISPKEKTNLVFNVGVDLFELMGLNDKPASDQEQVDFMEAGSVTVYITDFGNRYHKEDCVYLHTSKISIPLENALAQDYTPCSKCKPALRKDDDGVATSDEKLELNGYFGVKDLTYSATCNWDILSGEGLQDLYFDVNGTITAGLKVEGNLQWEISGRTTKYKLSNSIGFQGLKERLIPLAALHYSVNLTPTPIAGINANEQIRVLTSPMPLSVVGIVYVDGHGTLTVGFSAYFNYEKTFSYNKTIVRNGEFCYDSSYAPVEDKIETGIEVEVTADIDLHTGCGLDLYVFNLKVFQLDVAQVGVEAAGEAKLQYTNGVAQGEDNAFTWDAHVRGYFKLLQLKMELQAKLDILPWLDLSFDAQYDFCLWDKTLFEYGKPSDTRFDASTMSYSHITAKDSSATYHKDTAGRLIMVKEGKRFVLWDKPFFTICGIDKTYIYVLEENDSGTHNIRRIAKNGKTSKVVAEDVAQFLTIDEENMYFVQSFDKTVIRRLNRKTETVDTLANFSDNVVHMAKQGEHFYVVAGHSSWFWTTNEYILMDKNGNTIANYGTSPKVSELRMRNYANFSVGIKTSSSGYLRDTAEAVYWIGKDGSYKKINPVTGWNYCEGGVLTMERDSGDYIIVLYQAEDGSKVTLGSSEHSHALFTTAQDAQGRYYYLDQTSDEVILYTVSPDLSERSVIQRLPKSDFPVDLSECSVVLADGKFYFYTIPNDQTCDVLYQYNIH